MRPNIFSYAYLSGIHHIYWCICSVFLPIFPFSILTVPCILWIQILHQLYALYMYFMFKFFIEIFLKLKVFSLFSECASVSACVYVHRRTCMAQHVEILSFQYVPPGDWTQVVCQVCYRVPLSLTHLTGSFFFFFTIKIDLTQFCVCGCMCHTMSVNGRIQHVRGGFPTTWVPGIQLWSPGVAGNLPLLNDPSLRLKEGCTPFGDRQGYSPLY